MSVDVEDNVGQTPLLAGAEGGSRDVVELCVARGADLTRTNEFGATAAHLAAGHEGIARFLVTRGASVSAADARGRTPLHGAAASGYVLRAFPAKSPPRRRGQGSTSTLASTPGSSSGGGGGGADRPPTTRTEGEGEEGVDEIAVALEAAAGDSLDDADWEGVTPLMLAAGGSHVRSPLPCGRPALSHHPPTLSRQPIVVDAYSRAGAHVDAPDVRGLCALHYAALFPRELGADCVRALTESGADAGAAGRDGITPLMVASLRGATAAARELLRHGADAKATDWRGRTAVHYAAAGGEGGVLEAVRVLRARWCRVCSPLAYALCPVLQLLDHGAPPRVTDSLGLTPLACACLSPSRACVRLLLLRGASRSEEYPVETPAQAEEVQAYDMVVEGRLLESAAAQVQCAPSGLVADSEAEALAAGVTPWAQQAAAAGPLRDAAKRAMSAARGRQGTGPLGAVRQPKPQPTRGKASSRRHSLALHRAPTEKEAAEAGSRAVRPGSRRGPGRTTALHLAVAAGNKAAIAQLLEGIAQAPKLLAARDSRGDTPLAAGVRCGRGSSVRELLAAGATTAGLQLPTGRTLLHLATEAPPEQCEGGLIAQLADLGVPLEGRDSATGRTPCVARCLWGLTRAARLTQDPCLIPLPRADCTRRRRGTTARTLPLCWSAGRTWRRGTTGGGPPCTRQRRPGRRRPRGC